MAWLAGLEMCRVPHNQPSSALQDRLIPAQEATGEEMLADTEGTGM